MFCTKCGAEASEGNLFCTRCGARLPETWNMDSSQEGEDIFDEVAQNVSADSEAMFEEAVGQAAATAEPSPALSPQSSPAPSPEQKKKNATIIIAGIIGFAAVMLVIVLAMVILKPGINLTSEKTVEVEFDGGDKRGYASYEYDDDVFDDLEEKVLGKKPSDKKSLLWLSFITSISYELTPDSDLSNGDKVTLSVKWDKKSAKALGIKVKGNDRVLTVSGLEPATEIDVFKTLEVNFEGYNGNGKIDINNTSTDDFMYNVGFEADRNEGLSNGDKVKISANVNESALNKYNYVLKEKEKEYTVTGLEEMESLDLFEDISLEYSGTAPYAQLYVNKKSDNEFIDYYVYYEADKTEGISNGDIITVSASVDEDYAAQFGYSIGETAREYTVEGLDEYVKNYSEIPESILEEMTSQAEDALDSYIASQENWYDYQKLKVGTPEHVGNCFVKLKDGLTYGWGYSYENAVYMCYKAEKTFMENDRKKKEDVYLIICFKDFIKSSDGTIDVNIVDASVENTSYGAYEDFYDQVIRSVKEDYNIEEIKD